MVHYLVDFLFSCKRGTGQCAFLFSKFKQVTKELGVQLAYEKSEGPTSVLTFLGIEIDTVCQLFRLPADKLENLRAPIDRAVTWNTVTLLELQDLTNHLNFACKAVIPLFFNAFLMLW